MHLYGLLSTEWAWRFRVLKAEALVWRGMSKDALSVVAAKPPDRVSNEILIRRDVVIAMASCFVQQFQDADHAIAEAKSRASRYEPDLLGEVYLAQGLSALVRSNYSPARSAFEQALSVARQTHKLLLEASALGNLGVLSTRMDHYDEAIDWYHSALKVSEVLGNRTSTAKAMGNLGWCYWQLGDFDRALDSLEQAEKISNELGAIKDQQVWLSNIGAVYLMNHEYDKAEDSLLRSLAIARNLENRALEASTLNELTLAAIERKEFDHAARYNVEAERLNSVADDPDSRLYSLYDQALIAKGTGKLKRAEALLKRISSESAGNVSLKWESQAALADVYAQEKLDQRAESQFMIALADIDAARLSLARDEYRLSFFNTTTEFYNHYLDFLISRGRVEQALAVAEHSRARTLAEGLGMKLASLQTAHLNARQLAQHQRAVILAYWLKPKRSYLWAITPDRISLFMLPGENEINALVQEYRTRLTGPLDPLEGTTVAGQRLYKVLIGPAERLIPSNSRVVVVPDGTLYGLNFETLLVPLPKVHYWIDDTTISYVNSLAMLRSAGPQPRHAAPPRLLLIGDPTTASNEFPRLPQASREIDDVAAHFSAGRETVIVGPKATPSAYLNSNTSTFAYIHFVAHGTASRLSPLDSAVVLSPQGNSYKLYARDIVEKPLRAELVTISACYGTGNRAYSGEGLVGLSWAFLRAGARNVVAALWEANDISTPKLMDTMYAEIRRGGNPATALREAKLSLLHSGTIYRRPFYWAAFELYIGPGQTTSSFGVPRHLRKVATANNAARAR